MKINDRFTYDFDHLKFKGKITNLEEEKYRIWFRLISYEHGFFDVDIGKEFALSRRGFDRSAKILNEEMKPVSTYENKNKEKITNTIKKII